MLLALESEAVILLRWQPGTVDRCQPIKRCRKSHKWIAPRRMCDQLAQDSAQVDQQWILLPRMSSEKSFSVNKAD